MAERNHQKITDRVDAADEDPFAELTRIMGFDPRQPAPARQQPAPAPAAAAAEQPSYDPSFHIDLEKELMGDFGDEEEPQRMEAAPSWTAFEAAPATEMEAVTLDAPFDALEGGFDDTFEEDEPQPMQTAQSWSSPEPVATQADDVDLADDLDLAFDDMFADGRTPPVEPAQSWATPEPVIAETDDLELAFDDMSDDVQPNQVEPAQSWAASEPVIAEMDDLELAFDDMFSKGQPDQVEPVRVWMPREPEPVAAQADDLDLTFDELFDEEPQTAVAAPTWTAPEPVAAAGVELDLDEALTDFDRDDEPVAFEARAEEEFALELDEPAPAEAAADNFWMRDPEPAPQPLSYAAPAQIRPEEDDLAMGFDQALADVDMDFESHNAIAADDVLDDEESAKEAELASGEDVYSEDEEPFDHRYQPAPESVAYEAADLDADPLESGEVELELDPEPVHYADEDDPLFAAPVAVSTAIDEVDASPAAATEFDLEQELNALLGNTPQKPVYAATHRFEPVPVVTAAPVEDELDWNLDSEDLLAEDLLAEETTERAREDQVVQASAYPAGGYDEEGLENASVEAAELDFDLDDFDAAMAKEFAGEDLIGDFSLDGLPTQQSAPVGHEPSYAASEQYAAPSAVSYSRANTIASPVYSEPVAEDEIGEIDFEFSPAAFDEIPDIETVDVSDQAVVLADDLDLPEFVFEEQAAPVAAYDDLDSEFSTLINQMNVAEPAKARAGYDDDFGVAPAYVAAAAAAGYAGARAAKATHPAYEDDPAQSRYELGGYDPNDGRRAEANDADLDYDPALDDEISLSDPSLARERAPRQRRGMMLAAIVGGVAIVGGLGAFALSLGNGPSSDAPVIVKADNAPIKVKPETPGGAIVPNQESKVYDTVAGGRSAGEPQQKTLVTTAEEPIDVTPPVAEAPNLDLAPVEDAAEAAITPKGEDRIEQVIDDSAGKSDIEIAAVAPRKVRTMIVKPDGTLVPREDPIPAEAVAPANETVASVDQAPAADLATGSTSPVAGEAPVGDAQAPAADAAVPAEAEPALKPAAKAQSSTTPDSVPVAPQRPAEQPVDVVGEVKPDQVAAVSPSPTAAAAGGSWSMQIASQPSEAAAQASYQDLNRRYGSVLNGRQANIVKAEIAGKGTFWRVRVPAQSRNDAVALCESYKAAGGNCFVSR